MDIPSADLPITNHGEMLALDLTPLPHKVLISAQETLIGTKVAQVHAPEVGVTRVQGLAQDQTMASEVEGAVWYR